MIHSFLKMVSKSLFNIPNSVIFGITVILASILYVFNQPWTAVKVMILGSIVLFFSILYHFLFDNKVNIGETVPQSNSTIGELSQVNDSLTPVISKISYLIHHLKEKSLDNTRYAIVSRFMDEICEFEEVIPKLVKGYRKGTAFLQNKGMNIENEVRALQAKLQASSGSEARNTYEKALMEKRQTIVELQEIRNNLEDCESKLHYILSTLEKIDAMIEATELKDNITDEEAENIGQHLEVFSENIRDVIKIMKI